jgi:ArsR family transcriptional regulator
MDKNEKIKYESQAQILKAMAHPTRLLIVDKLSKKELCVCEITEIVGVDTSTISKHLSLMKNAGIIEDDKRGNNVYYRLKIPCVKGFFSCVNDVLKIQLKEHKAIFK